jgi:hypothetical protein
MVRAAISDKRSVDGLQKDLEKIARRNVRFTTAATKRGSGYGEDPRAVLPASREDDPMGCAGSAFLGGVSIRAAGYGLSRLRL